VDGGNGPVGARKEGRVMPYVVGLTGPLGAGKSTVAAMLRMLGAKVLDADGIVHDEQLRGTVGYSAIVQTCGTKVLGEDKEIERRAERGMRAREAELRLANQRSEEEFRAAADVVIVNDGDRDRTLDQVRDAWDRLSRARA